MLYAPTQREKVAEFNIQRDLNCIITRKSAGRSARASKVVSTVSLNHFRPFLFLFFPLPAQGKKNTKFPFECNCVSHRDFLYMYGEKKKNTYLFITFSRKGAAERESKRAPPRFQQMAMDERIFQCSANFRHYSQ